MTNPIEELRRYKDSHQIWGGIDCIKIDAILYLADKLQDRWDYAPNPNPKENPELWSLEKRKEQAEKLKKDLSPATKPYYSTCNGIIDQAFGLTGEREPEKEDKLLTKLCEIYRDITRNQKTVDVDKFLETFSKELRENADRYFEAYPCVPEAGGVFRTAINEQTVWKVRAK